MNVDFNRCCSRGYAVYCLRTYGASSKSTSAKTYMYACIYFYLCVYVCMYVCVRNFVCIYMCVCFYLCMYVCMCVK